jgi:hypothetical protein
MNALQNWLNKPFSADQSVEKWILFVGLIICISIGWFRVMRYITDEL